MSKPIPLPKLHKTSGRAYIYHVGTYHYFGKYGTPEADRKYWAWRTALAGGKPSSAVSACLVFDLLRLYRQNHKHLDHRERSRLNNLEAFDGIHHFTTAEYGPLAFQAHRSHLLSTGTRSARQVNDLCQFLQRIFRWGVSRQLVPLEVWTMLKTVERLKAHESPKQTVRRKPVPASLVAATLPHLSPHCADMVRLIVATGARPGEILSLRAEEIVKSYQARAGWWFAEKTKHKTASRGKRRFIEFPPETHAILHARMQAVTDGWLFPVMCPRKGQALWYQVSSLRQAIFHACQRAKVARWSPYSLRHSAITLAAGTHGLERAKEVAGHGDETTTMIYCHEPPRRTA